MRRSAINSISILGSTGEWVPLLTISSDDFKNASTPIAASSDNDGTTTPLTPTLVTNDGAETSEGTATTTVISEAATTASSVSPTQIPGESETSDTDDDQGAATTDKQSALGANETTTLLPPGLLGNVTERPSFPSLEGVDYRTSKLLFKGVSVDVMPSTWRH